MRRALFAIAVAFGLASWPLSVAADASPPAAEDPIITPPLAAFVVDQFWPAREAALTASDAHAIDALETDAAREYDQSWLKGAITDRPGGALPRTVTSRFVLVSRQMSYPASFIAVVQDKDALETRNPPWVYTVVQTFVRRTPESPWKLAVEAFPRKGTELLQRVWEPATDTFLPATVDNLRIDPSTLPATAAHRWPGWVIDPTKFAVYSVGLPNGTLLACFGLRYQKSETRPWWHPLHLGHDDRLGLPAGYYLTSQTTYLENRCIIDEPHDDSPAVVDVAQQSAYVSRSGIPAQPMPWMFIGLLGLTLSSGFGLLALRARPGPAPIATPAPSIKSVTLKAYQRGVVLGRLPLLLGAVFGALAAEQLLLELDPGAAISLPIAFVILTATLLIIGRRPLVARAAGIIPKPPAEVFTEIADSPDSTAVWPELVEVIQTSPGPAGVGTTYHQRQRMGDGRLVEFDIEITDFIRGQRCATRIVNGWTGQSTTWTLQQVPEGTRIDVATRLALGPILALTSLGMRRGMERAASQRLEKTITRLTRFLVEGTRATAEDESGPVFVNAYASLLHWLERRLNLRLGRRLSLLSLALTAAIAGVLNVWFAVGLVGCLVIHEFSHYFEMVSSGSDPKPPVFLGLAAFVMPGRLPADAITAARASLAGPLMATVACAGLAAIYAVVPDWHLLLWMCSAAALNLIGSVVPSRQLDSGAIMVVIGRWLPLAGLLIGLVLTAMSLLVAVPTYLLIPAAVFYTIGLSIRFNAPRKAYWATVQTRARLAFGAAWAVMALYLLLEGLLAALWL